MALNEGLVGEGLGLERVSRNWGWVLTAGVLYIVLGLIAFGMPVASTVGLTITIGALLIASGVIQLVHAFQMAKSPGTTGRFLQSVLSLVAGVLVFRYPGAGMMGVTIAMTFYFFMVGVAKWMLSSAIRPQKGWGWLFASALASFVLGAYMIGTFPISAYWVPGTILGIELVFWGASTISFSMSLRRLHQRIEDITQPENIRRVA